ncbi:MAG TPA: ABC transporter ATP-binding protein [Candidatus Dormibacteraeota bacterium]|jgi:ABC-type lipoprotein export system ATPase subunit
MAPIIEVRGLAHGYQGPAGPIPVLADLDLEVDPGSFVALVGPSGAGKTTLLAILGGLERPQSGVVLVGGHDLLTLGAAGLAAHRRRTVGFVFQHFGLMEALTARENVELALTVAGTPVRARRARALELLEQVGLAPRADHLPGRLSGGEQQRVGIARALANRPPVLLADEPTGNLDRRSGDLVLELLETARRETGCAVVLVTHEEHAAARADRTWLLEQGRLRAA